MPTSKPKILLVWGYHRKGWTKPFSALDADLDFHYLYFRSKAEESNEVVHTDCARSYWNDFATAHHVLDALRPQKIVFMSLAGIRAIALNLAARDRGIGTCIFQHGYFDTLDNYLHFFESQGRPHSPKRTPATVVNSSPLAGPTFMLRSHIRRHPIATGRAIAMMLDLRKSNQYRAQMRHRFRARFPDRYITYSDATSTLHRELDRASESQIHPIGIPEFDSLFREMSSASAEPGSGVLLLDSPNAENRYGLTTLSPSEKAGFLERLAEFLRSRRTSLQVKLHPENYDSTWLPSHRNIQYLRDGDIGSLILKAQACIGFDSTVLIPAIIFRPTLLIRLRPYLLASGAESLAAARVVDGIDIDEELIDQLLASSAPSQSAIQPFVERFAYKIDGRATERLGQLLEDPGW